MTPDSCCYLFIQNNFKVIGHATICLFVCSFSYSNADELVRCCKYPDPDLISQLRSWPCKPRKLENRSITNDLDRRSATETSSLLLRDLSSTFPRCSLENLCKRQTVIAKGFPECSGDAIKTDHGHRSPLDDSGVVGLEDGRTRVSIRVVGGVENIRFERQEFEIHEKAAVSVLCGFCCKSENMVIVNVVP